MKPNPFVSLKNFTVPVLIVFYLKLLYNKNNK
jgi:hypothetical protein